MTVIAVNTTLAALRSTQAALDAALTAASTMDSAATPSETPTPPGGQSPLNLPTPDPNNPFLTVTATLQAPTTPSPFVTPLMQTSTATVTTGLTPTLTLTTALAGDLPNDPTIAAEIEQALADAARTPTPPYVVATFTPVTPATEAPASFTPLPLATPTPLGGGLVNFMAPTTQNLTLMLLCLTFFTAGGLGILGLITSAIYMRSRRDNSEPPEQGW
jgi:hypothetical protein